MKKAIVKQLENIKKQSFLLLFKDSDFDTSFRYNSYSDCIEVLNLSLPSLTDEYKLNSQNIERISRDYLECSQIVVIK